MTKLHILRGPNKGESFAFKGDTIYVGRSPDNNVQIKDRSISRNHLKILRKGDKYLLEDLKSANGTFVDGRQISSGIEFDIGEGIPIIIGNAVICLGEAYPGDVMEIQDSIDLSKDIDEIDTVSVKERRRNYQKNMELISKVSNLLMQSLDIYEILEKVLDYIFDLLKRIDRAVIILIDRETKEISEVITRSRKGSDDTSTMYSRTIVSRVLKEEKPVIISDTYAEDEIDLSDSLKSLKIRSVMCVPLISRSQINGVIYIASTHKQYGFRKKDLTLLTALSSPVALTIDNALFYSDFGK